MAKIYVIINRGAVRSVFSTDKFTELEIVDLDSQEFETDVKNEKRFHQLKKRMASGLLFDLT